MYVCVLNMTTLGTEDKWQLESVLMLYASERRYFLNEEYPYSEVYIVPVGLPRQLRGKESACQCSLGLTPG